MQTSAARKTARWGLVWIVPFLLLLTALAAHNLNTDGLWGDEEWSIYDAGGAHYGPLSPAGIWQRVATEDSWQLPAYSWLLAGWGALVGWTEYAGRALSLLVGLLAIAMMYRLAYDLGDRKVSVGLTAAVTLGSGAFFIYYFHEIRGYTLYIFLTVACVWSYWRLTTRTPRPWIQAAFVLSIVGALYTHYFAALTPVVIGIYHLLFAPVRRASRPWWRVVILMGLAGLCFLPWITVALQIMSTAAAVRRVAYVNLRDEAETVLLLFSSGSPLLVLALFVLALATLRKVGRVVGLVWFWIIAWAGLAALAIAVLHVNQQRYLIGLWPALALLAALGMARIGIDPAPVIGLWLIVGVLGTRDAGLSEWFHPAIYHQPLREAAAALYGRVRSGDVVTYHLATDFEAYMHERVFTYYVYPLSVPNKVIEASSQGTEDAYTRQAQAAIQDAARIWITYNHWLRPERETLFERVLGANDFQQCGAFMTAAGQPDKAQIDVKLFVHFPRDPRFPAIQYGDGVTLRLVEPLTIARNRPGDSPVLPVVTTTALAESVPRGTYSVAIHVVNSAGQMVAQTDYALEDGCQASDIPLTGLPADRYTVLAAVYNWKTGERLPPAGDGVRADGRAVLGSFTVE